MKGQGRVSRRIASRGNSQKPRRGRFGDDEPEPIARGAANDEGWRVPGKTGESFRKKLAIASRLGKAGTRASGGLRAGETPRSASEECSRV